MIARAVAITGVVFACFAGCGSSGGAVAQGPADAGAKGPAESIESCAHTHPFDNPCGACLDTNCAMVLKTIQKYCPTYFACEAKCACGSKCQQDCQNQVEEVGCSQGIQGLGICAVGSCDAVCKTVLNALKG
jgi:hypothetical protein